MHLSPTSKLGYLSFNLFYMTNSECRALLKTLLGPPHIACYLVTIDNSTIRNKLICINAL